MMLNDINKLFKNRQGKIIGEYKEYAVMILVYKEKYIILEKRALTLRKQPGDICLPGGKVEKDELPLDAAIRECVEELNIKRSSINYIGEMDYLVTPYGSIIHVFVANIDIMPNNVNKEEVDSIIPVPLKYFMENEPQKYDINIGPIKYNDFPFDLIQGGKSYKFSNGILSQYFYQYDDIVIWGFTARIIKSFFDYIKG